MVQNEHKVLEQVKAGKSKNEILAETGHTVGLSDINLDIYPGEIFVIMGLSGSGKSTLIRHFNRLIEPTAGEIEIAGSDVMKLDSKGLQDFRRNKMSMVFQRFGLMPHRTVIAKYCLWFTSTRYCKRYTQCQSNRMVRYGWPCWLCKSIP